jgi:hypothetical protein
VEELIDLGILWGLIADVDNILPYLASEMDP